MNIAEKIARAKADYDAVFEAGKQAGGGGGGGNTEAAYNKGLADGKQAEYDRFWDDYQDNGQKTAYNQYAGAFLGTGWTDENFNPKYPIVPTDAAYMFRATGITDLTKDGVVLDFSNCEKFNYAFAYSKTLKKLPLIDLSSAKETTSLFADSIAESLILTFSENTNIASNMFSNAKWLTNLTIGGTIGMSISFANSPSLTVESVDSIIEHLKDLGEAQEQKLTLNTTVVANMLQAQKDAISAKNWTLVY